MNRRSIGSQREEMAASFLKKNGVRILERNFRVSSGEIDIIGKEGDIYVFFEVKYRKSAAAGFPVESVNGKKQLTICRVADYYRMTHGLDDTHSFRFDVIAILGETITWYRNAFEYHRYYR